MHPRLQELIHQLDMHHNVLLTEVDRIPATLRATRPAPDRWSVAEVLSHLATVATGIGTRIREAVATARANGATADTETSLVADSIDVARILDRSAPIVATPGATPQDSPTEPAARERLESAHAALRSIIAEIDGIDLSKLSMPHRIFGDMNFYQWIAFVGAHESRHAAQVAEIGASLGEGRRPS